MSCAKRVSAIILAVAFLLSLPGMIIAQEKKVAEVAISGNVNINTETIRNVISLQPGMDFSEEAIEKDRNAIMGLGYFSTITPHIEDVPGGVKVTYEVTENPKISEVKIVGSEPIAADVVLGLMKTKANQVLNSETLNLDVEAIQAYYGEQGYIAYVTEDLGIDPKTGVLTVPILVNRVESVVITGNKKTKDWALIREMKTQPGKVFNVKVLKEDIIRIYNLDILEDIKPYQITPGAEIGMVKITIPVVEKKTGLVSLGFGYSSRQRLVGQARLSETNFRGRAQGLNLLWQQGTSNAVGGPASQELGFYEPWIDKRHTSLSVNAYNKLLYRFSSGVFNSASFANDENYSERHQGGDVTLSRPLTEKTRVYVGGRYEDVKTAEGLLSNIVGDLDLYKMVMQGTVAAGSVRLVHNTRDFDLDPAAGQYEGVSLELGSVSGNTFERDPNDLAVFLKSPFDGSFAKGSVDVRRYFSKGGRKLTPQDKRVTLALRLRAGTASGKLPFFEQFFVGGAESLRGYREDRFWGDKMLLASAELRKPIAQSIAGVVFVDYGSAWGGNPNFFITQLPQSRSFDGFFGTGVGLRVNTPIGHLRLDYGIGSEGSRTHFSMGQAF